MLVTETLLKVLPKFYVLSCVCMFHSLDGLD